MELTLKFEVKCGDCGSDLSATIPESEGEMFCLEVEACKNCLEQVRSDGREDGYEEGYNRGRDGLDG